ncbi:maleylacetate reductase [Kribbella amoyensis]|uniref:Maleylacetate reductase n=1 Tax=Kribbella amoyensis TaxID=996641 RepID=A0A561BMQ9_9ACTN|nr:maleylacetate reductase [Kribbella amoyensis]TWD80180.1 maleylacetate reductase [Kribbella amoyensis]
MAESFVHVEPGGRIVFGPGTLDRVPDEVDLLGIGIGRVLLIATASARDDADLLEVGLGDRFAGRIDGVRQHVPIEQAEVARAKAAEVDARGLVALGGGSAVGLAKAIALTTGLPIIAIPTTYAGSERTPVWGLTVDGRKSTGTDPVVLPRTVVYDPLLSRRLPVTVTAASVANAIAHCVEAIWTPKADPLTEVVAIEGARTLRAGLLGVLAERTDLEARSNLLLGACLAGSALAQAGTGLHHQLCHLLGGQFGLPHAETHAAVLPQVTRLLAGNVPRAKARMEAALETEDLATGLFDLFQAAGVPTSLGELGLTEEQAVAAAKSFDGQVSVDQLTDLLVRAWSGRRPEGTGR